MQKIIDETEKRAYVFLHEFGFAEQEIAPVIAKGLFDLENTLEKLRNILASSPEGRREELDDVLHALKGLLFQLGNREIAEKIEALRGYDDPVRQYDDLRRLLF